MLVCSYALNCLLQKEQVNSETDDTDDDPVSSGFALLVLSFSFADSLCFIVICSLFVCQTALSCALYSQDSGGMLKSFREAFRVSL